MDKSIGGRKLGAKKGKKRIWLIEGEPGSGKTTALSRITLAVKSKGYTVGGVLTREIRSRGEREGFRIVNIATEESEILAHVKGVLGPRIGKYRVNLKALSSLAVSALEFARANSDMVVCDEIGPMELLSPDFRRAVRESVLESSRPCVCVIHKRYSDPLIEELRSSQESVVIEVNYETRETIPGEVAEDVFSSLSKEETTKN